MKRWCVFGVAVVLMLGGCGVQLPDMSDAQAKKIGEYAAISLLKYDANSRSRLVDLSLLAEQESQEALQEPVNETPEITDPASEDTPVIELEEKPILIERIESILDMAYGVTVDYIGYEVCQSYPSDASAYFSLEATAKKRLLVLNFQIKNTSDMDQSVNLLTRRDIYRVKVNGDYTRAALTTMLPNDMATYVGTIAAGASEKVVLVIEVDLEDAENLTSIDLDLKTDISSYTIPLMQ